MAWNLRTGGFFRALGTGSMAGPSASEVIFIAVNHSITLMGELTSLTEISWFQKHKCLVIESICVDIIIMVKSQTATVY